MDKYYSEKPFSIESNANFDGENISKGDFWSIKEKEGKYYFEYISEELEGRLKKIEISKDDAEKIICKNNVDWIFSKYNIY